MRFFHIADLHIGIKLYNRDLYDDQRAVLDQITAAAAKEQPDAIVIAGDVYDKAVPPAEAVELFNSFISGLSVAVPGADIMMISGNHDSAARLDLYRDILSRQKIHCIGQPPRAEDEHICKLTLTDEYGPVNFYLLPFVKPSVVKAITGVDENGNNLSYDETVRRLIEREHIDESARNVLVSHQFYIPAGKDASEVERTDCEWITVGNIDAVCADVLKPFDYTALGHIHRPMSVGSEFIRYPGTPLPCSVSEAGQQKGIIEVEMREKGDVRTSIIPLIPLHEISVIKGTLKDVLPQACEDYVSVILTDKNDLDVFDMQDRLRHAFPKLLEIRRETAGTGDMTADIDTEEMPDPFTLCLSFLKDADDADRLILQNALNAVWEEGEV